MFVVLRHHEKKKKKKRHHGWSGVFFFGSKLNRQTKNSKIFNVYILVIKTICYTVINKTKRKENKSLNKV